MKSNSVCCFFLLFLMCFSSGFISSNIAWSDNEVSEFAVTRDGDLQYSCSKNGMVWEKVLSGVVLESINSVNNCSNVSGDGTSCCPDGWGCNLSTNTCQKTEEQTCGDYRDKESCEGYKKKLAESSVESSVNQVGFCGSQEMVADICVRAISDCRCAWEGEKCVAKYNSSEYCALDLDGSSKVSQGEPKGVCSISSSIIENNCDTLGTYKISNTASWSGNISAYGYINCKDSSYSIGCYDSIRIPFFSGFSFIAALFLVCFFYAIFSIRKKN
jgi:hypothetical protein